jgi:putative protease
MSPDGNVSLVLAEMLDKHDKPIDVAKGSGWIVRIPNPFITTNFDILRFALIMRNEAWGGDTKRDLAAKKLASIQISL